MFHSIFLIETTTERDQFPLTLCLFKIYQIVDVEVDHPSLAPAIHSELKINDGELGREGNNC